jgi:hypothetical protein
LTTFDDPELDDMLRTAMQDDAPDVSALLTRVRREMKAEAAPRRLALTTLVMRAVAAALFITIVAGALIIRSTRNSALALDAACDHFDELVQDSDKQWTTAPADVDAYVHAHFPGKRDIVGALAPPGASFEKLASCRLLTARFAHFVYRSEGREVSVFVRISDPHQSPVRRIDYFDHRLKLQVAGFVTPRYEGLVVSTVSSQAARSIADTLASRL